MDALAILLAPAILVTLMILSHTYLGLHVLERGIIFVDGSVALSKFRQINFNEINPL